MPASAEMTTRIEFPPTPAGVADAREELDRFAALFGEDELGADASPGPDEAPAAAADEAPRAVYRSSTEGSRTRELLKGLPGDIDQAMTPAEIGEQLLRRNDDGSPLSPAQVRAVMRNEKKIEGTLKKRGVIPEDRVVLRIDWSRYESEGCARYYVSAADSAVIRSL